MYVFDSIGDMFLEVKIIYSMITNIKVLNAKMLERQNEYITRQRDVNMTINRIIEAVHSNDYLNDADYDNLFSKMTI
jgi:hypothetical protein